MLPGAILNGAALVGGNLLLCGSVSADGAGVGTAAPAPLAEDPDFSDYQYELEALLDESRNMSDLDDLTMDDLTSFIDMFGSFGGDPSSNSSSSSSSSGVSSTDMAAWDNLFREDFIMRMSQKDTSLTEFILEGVLLMAVSLFGLVGNVVAIVVLSRPTMRGSFSTLLIGKKTLQEISLCLFFSEMIRGEII